MSPSIFKDKKRKNKKISMVTCYDAWSAKILDKTDIDILLVGDSLTMVVYGHDSTLPANIPTMALHTAAVKRGSGQKFITVDMPFMSLHKGVSTAMQNIECLMKAGANAIKIEGAFGNEKVIQRSLQAGVPVMGHLGLTPQSINHLGGFKVQGKTSHEKNIIIEQAKLLETLGCFAIVLECVPSSLAKEVTSILEIPTIGIGAGVDVDGQVLVLQDLLGMDESFNPKYLRKYLTGYDLLHKALSQFDKDVKTGKYPNEEEMYD